MESFNGVEFACHVDITIKYQFDVQGFLATQRVCANEVF
jgi:hypothetical protein